jgi:hypothetical protein
VSGCHIKHSIVRSIHLSYLLLLSPYPYSSIMRREGTRKRLLFSIRDTFSWMMASKGFGGRFRRRLGDVILSSRPRLLLARGSFRAVPPASSTVGAYGDICACMEALNEETSNTGGRRQSGESSHWPWRYREEAPGSRCYTH